MEELDKRKKAASESSARRDALSVAGGSSSHDNNANKHRSRMEHMDPAARREVTRALNTSFMTMDVNDNVMPKTPPDAIMAAATYLASHPPLVGDPKSTMHKSALAGLGLGGATLHDEALRSRRKKLRSNSPAALHPHPTGTSTICLDVRRDHGAAAAT